MKLKSTSTYGKADFEALDKDQANQVALNEYGSVDSKNGNTSRDMTAIKFFRPGDAKKSRQ